MLDQLETPRKSRPARPGLRSAIALAFVAALSTTSETARADQAGFVGNRFEPAERGSQWFVLESLDLRGHFRPGIGATFDYAYRPLVITESSGKIRSDLVSHIVTTHIGLTQILFDRVRVGGDAPIVHYTDGEGGAVRGVAYAPPADRQTIGDARLTVDVRLFGRHDGPLTMAAGARLWIPTGSTTSYLGEGSTRLGPRFLAAGASGLFVYAAQLGATFSTADPKTLGDTPVVGQVLTYGASAGMRAEEGRVVVGPEIYGSSVLTEPFATHTSPLELLLGGHVSVGGFRFGTGVGTGLVGGVGAAQLRLLASIEWSPEIVVDTDGDNIPDSLDACKTVKGPWSSDPETRGCPSVATLDTDGDGIPDTEDACMDVQGIRTNDKRTNGCVDRDGDGLMDPLDHCPFEAGPPSKDPEQNGCPPRDQDQDGILDEVDACPDVPGDAAHKGCPPPPPPTDRDGDGVLDPDDACPDDPGDADPNDRRRNGCPAAFVRGDQIRTLDQVKFKAGSALIETGKDSEAVLEAVLAILKAHPEMTKVRIEGHTDNRGDVRGNKALSEARAASVAKWLALHGIEKKRLESKGFGIERPIDSNDTEEGRRVNRRVEIHIEKQP